MDNFLAWTAGFFDGEGSVIIYVQYPKGERKDGKKYSNDHYSMQTAIAQNHREPLEDIVERFGGSVCAPTIQKPREKQNYRWAASGPTAKAFLEKILPYLRVKKRQAEIGIEFQETVRSAPEITQRDVAKHLGIGNSTVNACLKGTYRGSDSMVDKVKQAAEELGYENKGYEVSSEIMEKRRELFEELRVLNKKGIAL